MKNRKLFVLTVLCMILAFALSACQSTPPSSEAEKGEASLIDNIDFGYIHHNNFEKYSWYIVNKNHILAEARQNQPFNVQGNYIGTRDYLYAIVSEQKMESLAIDTKDNNFFYPIYRNGEKIYYMVEGVLYLYDEKKQKSQEIATGVYHVIGSPDAETIVYITHENEVIWKRADETKTLKLQGEPIAVRNNGDVIYRYDFMNEKELRIWSEGKEETLLAYDGRTSDALIATENFEEAVLINNGNLYLYSNGEMKKLQGGFVLPEPNSYNRILPVTDEFDNRNVYQDDVLYTLEGQDTISDLVFWAEKSLVYIDKDRKLHVIEDEIQVDSEFIYDIAKRVGDFVYYVSNEGLLIQYKLKTGEKEEIASMKAFDSVAASYDGALVYYLDEGTLYRKAKGSEAEAIAAVAKMWHYGVNRDGSALYISQGKPYVISKNGETSEVKVSAKALAAECVSFGGDDYFYLTLEDGIVYSEDGKDFKSMEDGNKIEIN